MKKTSYEYLYSPLFGGEYMGGWLKFDRSWAGGKVYMHEGSNTQNLSSVWIAPLKNFAVMVATNQAGDAAMQACNKVIGELVAQVAKLQA